MALYIFILSTPLPLGPCAWCLVEKGDSMLGVPWSGLAMALVSHVPYYSSVFILEPHFSPRMKVSIPVSAVFSILGLWCLIRLLVDDKALEMRGSNLALLEMAMEHGHRTLVCNVQLME